MKLSHLKQIAHYLQNFKKISSIHRVSDSVVKIVFDRDDELYFDMTRSSSKIFKCSSYPRSKIYGAPFDIAVAKRFNRSTILNIELLNDDKILRFKTSLASAYKEEILFLQFEFTGKHTNVIILNESEIVLEALRHVDLFSSFREVRVGQKLLDVPQNLFTPKEYLIDDMDSFLQDEFAKEMSEKLSLLKKQKLSILEKKLQKLQKLYLQLEDQKTLENEAQELSHLGGIFLANMHNIKPYQKRVELLDYDGKKVEILFHKEFSSVSQMSNSLFSRSKKAKQKALHLHIEKESLESKIEHIKLFINSVNEAKEIAKIELLFPKNGQNKKIKMSDSVEYFWIEGYKVGLGKNQKGNIELLQNAKARDIWVHMKDRPSAHVIISTDKQNIPQSVIETSAKLCVEFTMFEKDRYLVDYTQRREVSIQDGANVFYNKYKTIEVDTRS